jgi:outer membrane receptor for ferrienterochelin and colicins
MFSTSCAPAGSVRCRISLALALIAISTTTNPGFIAVASAAVHQEPRARLTVTVRDSSGVLPGAIVTLRPAGSAAAPVSATAASPASTSTAPTRGELRSAATDAQGSAVLDNLEAGTYDLHVTFPGFADAHRAKVAVGATSTPTIEIVMTLPQFSSEVTVTTANRREQLLLDVADPTVLIDEGQIADTGARTAKDLLIEQSGSGIQVNAGGGQGYLSLNGIPNSGVLVLIDGRRYLGRDANGNFNLEDLPLTGIDRVEVVKGAGSALYGSDALGGVVNFITRRSTARGATSLLDVSGGSYGDARVDESAGWRGSRGGVNGSAGYRTYDGFDLSAENPQTIGQPASTWRSGSINGDARLTDRLFARIYADGSRREIDHYFFSGATQTAASVYDSQRELTRYAVSPTVDYQIDDRTSLGVSYTHGLYARDETRVFVVGGNVVPQAPWREWNDELKVTAGHTFRVFDTEHPLQGGIERRQEKLRRGTLSVTDPSRDINVAWVQQEVSLGSHWRVTGGVRYDDYSDFGSEWSPKGSVVYRVAEGQRIRASAGHGFRPPYFGELYLNTPPSFVGNPNLKPETANTFNVGYSWASANAQLSADYFHSRVENGITFDLSDLPFTYANLNTFTAKGTNLAGSIALRGGFTPSVSYTYTRREDEEGEVGGFPHHAAFVKLLWMDSRWGLRANVRGQLLSEVPPASDGSFQPGYGVWYAQVAKRLRIGGPHDVNLYAQVSNIFDKRDIFLRDEAGQPIPGQFQVWLPPRTFLAGVTVDLDWTR